MSIVKRVTTDTVSGGQGWVGDNINNGRLDCFYGLLSILSFINFGFYLLCAAWYKPKREEGLLMVCWWRRNASVVGKIELSDLVLR